MPIFTSGGCCMTNALAASRAASMRLGSTSVARMLSETSMHRMIVRCSDGRGIVALGRAIAPMSAVIANRNTSGGAWGRERWAGAVAGEAGAGAERFLHQAETCIAQRRFPLASKEQHVEPGQGRYQEQQPERLGPEKRHGCQLACLTCRIRIAQLHLGDLGQSVGVKLELCRRDIFPELGHRGCADNRCTQEPAALYVAERELGRRDAASTREIDVRSDGLGHHRLAEAHAQAIEQSKARVGGLYTVEILARENPARERTVGQERHLFAKQ